MKTENVKMREREREMIHVATMGQAVKESRVIVTAKLRRVELLEQQRRTQELVEQVKNLND